MPGIDGSVNPDWVTLENCYEADVQLHQFEAAFCDIVIHFTNDDGVPQDSVVSFWFDIMAHQFNEEPGS
jgi:hypothetical protein